MIYRVAFIRSVVDEEFIEARSVDDAQKQWEDKGYDADLFFIEDESGNQVIFD